MIIEQEIAKLKRQISLPSMPESAKEELRIRLKQLEEKAEKSEPTKSEEKPAPQRTIEEEIAKLKRQISLPSMPETAKDELRTRLKALEEKNQKSETKKTQSKPAAKKPAPKKEPKVKFVKKAKEKEKKSEEPTPMEIKKTPKKRGRKPSATKKPVSQEPKVLKKRGRKPKKKETPALKTRVKKTYKPTVKVKEGEPDCDTLLKQFRERRAKAKASQKKRKTTPVFRKIASDVVDAVEKAIKNVPATKIKESPKVMIRKFGTLQKAADGFLKAFRDILGKDYNTNQAQIEINDLKNLIQKLVKKYSVK